MRPSSYCCGSRMAAYSGAASAFRTRHPHTLYCGIADRILRRHRQLIGALAARPVIRNEDRVRPNLRHDLRAQRNGSTSGLGRRPIAVRDAQLRREPWMELDTRFRILLNERTDASSLRSGQELTDYTTRRQVDWILL